MLNLGRGMVEEESALILGLRPVERDRKEDLLMAEASLDLLDQLHSSCHRQGKDGSGHGLAYGYLLRASHYFMMASAGVE